MSEVSSSPQITGKPRRRVSWKLRFLLMLLGLLLGFAAAEGVLVAMGVSYPLPYRVDEHCGTGLSPGFRGWWSKEGAAEIRINSAGFRDREHTLEKPENVLRVAVLGDSYIEAFQVSQDEMLASVLERELNTKRFAGDCKVEVLSFGVSGYGTTQELLMLRHHVWQFDPDIVLLAFLPANDLRNNSSRLESQQLRPVFEMVDDALVLDNSFRTDPTFLYAKTDSFRIKTALINSSRVLQLVQSIRNGEFSTDRTVKDQIDGNDNSRDRVGLDDQCFRPPENDDWQHAWKLTERLIVEMNQEVVDHGSRFAMTVVTSGIQVNSDAKKRQDYCKRLGVTDLNYADTRLRKLGERADFPVIVLSEDLRAYDEEHQVNAHGFSNTQPGEGHWNATGHREAARICARELLRTWPPIIAER
ncbi:MAG: SGNH/GDSL hydrolase family protein [Rhodopirellula sp.]|nr:SGNH/GDSL hydrolase family protein [Rhodopirellula sp.]